MRIRATMTNVFFSTKNHDFLLFSVGLLFIGCLFNHHFLFFFSLDVCQIQNVAVVQVQHKMRTKTGK